MRFALRLGSVGLLAVAVVAAALVPCTCPAAVAAPEDHGCCDRGEGLRAADHACCLAASGPSPAASTQAAPVAPGSLVAAQAPLSVDLPHAATSAPSLTVFVPSPHPLVLRI